jgi:hypothetical protein
VPVNRILLPSSLTVRLTPFLELRLGKPDAREGFPAAPPLLTAVDSAAQVVQQE